MSEGKPNAVIGQSGGPTAVINQSLVGCVEALQASGKIGKILGAHHAVQGMVADDYIELQDMDQASLDKVANAPSAALGSSRDKPDAAYCEKILENFMKNNVQYFFYAGGNDSSDTCRIINEMAEAKGYEMHAFHIPKTVDNDLVINDHTPGFGSAARTVGLVFMGDNLDNKALPGVKINVCMGRHAGFLTASAVLGRLHDEDGPHLIYVPERAFDIDQFLKDVDEVYKKYGRCLIAVSEGISDKEGTPITVKLAEDLQTDDHGNVQLAGIGALGDHLAKLVKEKLGISRVRADTLGYMQRHFPGGISVVDQAEARAAGKAAAEAALSGEKSGSIAIIRTSDDPYTVEYKQIAISDVAAKTRHLPEEYIVGDNDIAPAYAEYLKPLVGDLPDLGYLFK